jgi:hypothetical protein
MLLSSGANPTTASYNASVVNFYNATGSLERFENKNILCYFEKRSSLLQSWRCSYKFRSRRIGPWLQIREDDSVFYCGYGDNIKVYLIVYLHICKLRKHVKFIFKCK